jgi:hypothetical protein
VLLRKNALGINKPEHDLEMLIKSLFSRFSPIEFRQIRHLHDQCCSVELINKQWDSYLGCAPYVSLVQHLLDSPLLPEQLYRKLKAVIMTSFPRQVAP